ncbi:hypothetical protein C6501_07970 [Candidatus Poribacteria bacterium]|nr:MAG: hypothetical protein C6501_07970 [Candidatus Poribacteria bacterium]
MVLAAAHSSNLFMVPEVRKRYMQHWLLLKGSYMSSDINIDKQYLIETLRQLIGINSILPNETQISEFIADQLQDLGVDPEWHEVAPGRPNVYATAKIGTQDRFLVLSGHSDTVGVASGWETDPFVMTEQDGRLYGLGAVNMKGGIACTLAAFKALVEADVGRRGRLGFAVTADQEGHSIGARALLKTDYGKCDAMLHAEHFFGSSEKDYLPSAVTGKVLYKLTVKGRAAHAFRPHLGGINAVEDASKIVTALDRLPLRDDKTFGKGTICTLRIEGGYAEYSIVVPERCEIVITRLTVPGETREVAVNDMRELIDSLGLTSQVDIETPPPCYDPYFLDEDLEIVSCFTDSYKSVLGQDPYFSGHRGIVDANVFVAEGGIPTVVFGPRGANHHCPGEYVEMSTLVPTAHVLADTGKKYLS